jgi:hypothetical protein
VETPYEAPEIEELPSPDWLEPLQPFIADFADAALWDGWIYLLAAVPLAFLAWRINHPKNDD